ncbi:hypothetical protein LTR85_008995 [Meristemomyces frigidus]|nr:hypothetical protein LTR85_008995 [Meristemomyces frigidus]
MAICHLPHAAAKKEGREWVQWLAWKMYHNEEAGLPKEVVGLVLDAMVKEHFRGPHELLSWKNLTVATGEMLHPLTRHAGPKHSAKAKNEWNKDDAFFEDFEQEVARANVLPNIIFRITDPKFPKQTVIVPYPIDFKDHIHRILHLEILIHIRWATGADTYPIELYRLQDNIANLKTWFPKLKSVRITIDHPQRGRSRARLPAGLTGAATRISEELEKLIIEYRKLDIGEKYFWYDEQAQWRLTNAKSWQSAEYPETDMREKKIEEVVEEVLQYVIVRV